jgi:hypothetical protein
VAYDELANWIRRLNLTRAGAGSARVSANPSSATNGSQKYIPPVGRVHDVCGRGGLCVARATGVAWSSKKIRRIDDTDQGSGPARLGDGPKIV